MTVAFLVGRLIHPADLGFEFSTGDVVCFPEAKKATEIAMPHRTP